MKLHELLSDKGFRGLIKSRTYEKKTPAKISHFVNDAPHRIESSYRSAF